MVSRGFYLLYTVPMPHSPGEKHPEVKKYRMKEKQGEKIVWKKEEEGGKKVIER